MSQLQDIWIKAETLETLASTVKKKGDKGIAITISVSDEANEYDQNVTAYVSQTKEEREAKKNRFYVGNGKVFWTDGNPAFVPKKSDSSHTPKQEYSSPVDDSEEDKLPF